MRKIGERNDVTDVEERKRNFDNDIAKIKNKKNEKLNCGNWISEIGGLKKKRKKENWTVERVMLRPHTILPYFLQTGVMANFLLVLIRAHQ